MRQDREHFIIDGEKEGVGTDVFWIENKPLVGVFTLLEYGSRADPGGGAGR